MIVRDMDQLAQATQRQHRQAQGYESGDPCQICGVGDRWYTDAGSRQCDGCGHLTLSQVAARIAGLKPDKEVLNGLSDKLGVITWAEHLANHAGVQLPQRPFGFVDREFVRSRAYEHYGRVDVGNGYLRGASLRARGRFVDGAAYERAREDYARSVDDDG